MKLGPILQSEKAAWIIGAAAVGISAAVAYWLVGWLGIGLLGVLGLTVSHNADLHSDRAVIHSGPGTSAVSIIAKQLESLASPSSPEQKMAAAAAHEKKSRTHYLVNTVFIAMTIFGLSLFVVHQLP